MINSINKLIIKLLKEENWVGRLLLFIRKRITKYYDPEIQSFVGGKDIFLNLSHMLPVYKATLKLYDTALPRIVQYLYDINNKLVIIDVGANIGDTAALIHEVCPEATIICIEGSENFANLLEKNYGENEKVKIERTFLTDKTSSSNKKLISQNGTATLNHETSSVDDDIQNTVSIDKLDNVISSKYKDLNIDLIKVDTDGFDYKVLRGSEQILIQHKPMIYFELVPALLKNNDENVMSIFTFLIELNYKYVMFYDNLGYLIGLHNINNLENIEMLTNYVDSRNMYLDVLVSVENINSLYKSETNKINEILNLKKLKVRYGYQNKVND